MNKICTSIEQSKKLIELGIDRKTSDMYWWYNGQKYYAETKEHNDFQKRDIPAWSLAALLSVIPEVSLNTFKDGKWNAMIQHDGKMIYSDTDNPVDACYEMILKLHELKLL